MTDPGQLSPVRRDEPALVFRQVEIASPEFSRFLYQTAGGDWHWIDRLPWTREEWLEHLERAGHETWVAYLAGTPAGYFELERQEQGNVEIGYLGLLPSFLGRGLGGRLLTAAIERAWAMGAKRVWVHTCSLDHPAALANYQARGMRVYKDEVGYKDLPTSKRDQ